ncbi:MAG: penicillin-binding protein 2 [Actinomycetia bacterium]|nr:penicillin-binding protein 2 [Actinomycetes bacterium]
MTGKINNFKVNRRRIYFLFILFLIAFSLISYRLVSIQYLDASKYRTYAQFQHMGEFELYSKRGKILDRNGNELAVSLIEKTVYANPKEIEDPGYVSDLISEILGIDRNNLEKKLLDKTLGFVYIERKIGSEEANKIARLIARLDLKGIYMQDESKRYYPQYELAGAIIGFTGTDGNGLYGIEIEYESTLRGVNGRAEAEKDVLGNIIPGNIKTYLEPVDGKDITLTLDSQIQYITEKSLAAAVEKYNAPGAVAIVMDPKNGEILAMASYPGFDPNDYQDYDEYSYKPAGISFTYEPGSTFKVINIASALENNTVGKEQVFNLPPYIQVSDRVIREIFRTGNIQYSTKEIIQHSSNIGAVVVALSMGDRLYWEGIKRFGFGERTGIELPGEENGIVHDYTTWPASTIGALAIGQSISVTPLQLLRAVCCIANGGYLVNPTIIKETGLGAAQDPESGDGGGDRIISEETARAVKDMMLAVVEDGTGKNAQIEDVSVCGKTGTAEKVNQNGRGYSEGRSITSFVGFAPYENPEIAIIIVVDEPQGPERTVWGGTVAAPVFKEIMKYSLERIKVFK